MGCVQCGGPYHPASGHWYERWDVVVCGGCYKPFVRWVKGMMARKWSGAAFYEEAATSIRPRRRDVWHPDCEVEVTRAGGDVLCEICGQTYYRHPHCSASKFEGWSDGYYATVLCDGRHVHL